MPDYPLLNHALRCEPDDAFLDQTSGIVAHLKVVSDARACYAQLRGPN